MTRAGTLFIGQPGLDTEQFLKTQALIISLTILNQLIGQTVILLFEMTVLITEPDEEDVPLPDLMNGIDRHPKEMVQRGGHFKNQLPE